MFLGPGLSEHIDELRRRLKVVFITLVVTIVVVLLLPVKPSEILGLNFTTIYWTTPVSVLLHSVEAYTLPSSFRLIALTVGAPLEVLLYASLVLSLAIDMPVIVYEVYRFVDPALKKEEKSMVYPVITSATALFAVGILFGYFILARFIFIAMVPFYSATGLTPPYLIAISDFMAIVFLSVLFSGLAFVTPVFVYLLIRFGVVPPSFFSKNRVLIWAATYIVTAIITPDGGPVLDVLLFVPVIALLEASVFIGRRYVKQGERQEGPKCSYCGEPFSQPRLFCPNCGRSVA